MTPKTKVFYNSKPVHFTRTPKGTFNTKLRKVWHYTKITAAISIVFAAAVFTVAASLATTTVTASTTIVQTPVQSPVLDRIAQCESGGHQYAPSGQVLMKPNTNGTIDVGKYQINSVWFKKATELGYNLTNEADNKAMAEWIYQNKGTGDWASSAHCWNK